MAGYPADLLGIGPACCNGSTVVPELCKKTILLKCAGCGKDVKRIAILDFAAPAERLAFPVPPARTCSIARSQAG